MDRIAVRVAAVREEARDIRAYDLATASGAALPAFDAGSHVSVFLPNGLARSYSLVGAADDRRAYTIAVKCERNGRGGSAFIHDHVQVGAEFEIGTPLNNFRLDEHAPHSVLVAGGIGITPIYAMAKRLTELGRSWEMLYAARSPEDAAFYRTLTTMEGGKVRFFFLKRRAISSTSPMRFGADRMARISIVAGRRRCWTNSWRRPLPRPPSFTPSGSPAAPTKALAPGSP